MAVTNPPIAISTRNDHNYDDFMQAISAGFAGTSALRPAPGVVPSWGAELAVSTGTGLQVVVGSGVVMIPTPDPGRGGWLVTNNASITISLAAAHPSNGRIDRLIARVSDAQYHSGADNMAAIEVITGTPSATPAVPAVPTSKGEYVELRRIPVGAGVSSLDADDLALPPGGVPYTDSVGHGPWVSYTTTLHGTGASLGTGTLTARYKKTGRTVHFDWLLIGGTATTFGTEGGGVSDLLPAPPYADTPLDFPATLRSVSGATTTGAVSKNAGGDWWDIWSDGVAVTGAWPGAYRLRISGTYEAAG